jgi:cytolysin (calcineurin-like family phosphatase)
MRRRLPASGPSLSAPLSLWLLALAGSCQVGDPAGAPDRRPAGARAVTFFAFGDPQYGGGPGDKNAFHIQALAAAPRLVWPEGFSGAGGPVGDPRGVIIAGDLTQNGHAGRNREGELFTADRYAVDLNREYGADLERPLVSSELGLFLADYGLRGGDGRNPHVLPWRVFEGYGNHDFDPIMNQPTFYGTDAPARDVVAIRNRVRATWPEVRRTAPGNAGHYAWDWDDVHFVQLNLVGADATTHPEQPPRDPQGGLTFLIEDLAAQVGGSCRPVLVIMHYGFDAFSTQERWWDATQRRAFLAALAPYNVLAILHGHAHQTRAYETVDEAGRAYPVIALGSPFYDLPASNAGRGHFAVFRIGPRLIEGANVSWLPANPVFTTTDGQDLWTGKRLGDLGFHTTTPFEDGWGGWRFTGTTDRPCP